MTHIVTTGQQKFNFNSGNFCIVIKDNTFHSISIIFMALKRILCIFEKMTYFIIRVLLQKQTIGKITFTNKTENTHKKDKPCVLFNKIVDNPHFWIFYSTFFHMHEAQLPHFAAVHSKIIIVLDAYINRENKTAFS